MAQSKAMLLGRSRGCWLRGLLLLCLSGLPSAAAVGTGCGTQDSFTPASWTPASAPEGSFPWMVSLQDLPNGHLAFGAILSPHWIVTAASSIYGSFLRFASSVDRAQVVALIGMESLKVPIRTVVPHEAFDEITWVHNIALLKTTAPIQFSETVQPVCFPYETFPANALENCWVVGSLQPGQDRTGENSLWKLPVVDIDPCPLHRIMTTECCSHREGDSVPGCLGYPGNPVVCQAEVTWLWLLKGILTEGGARCYGPFLYTKVSAYSEWIVSTTARWGAPVSPISGWRRWAARAQGEQRSRAAEAALEHTALSSSEDQLALNWTQESKESSHELPDQLGESRGGTDPIYYDYYAGELVPISTAAMDQPWGLWGAILPRFLLLGLTAWMAS